MVTLRDAKLIIDRLAKKDIRATITMAENGNYWNVAIIGTEIRLVK